MSTQHTTKTPGGSRRRDKGGKTTWQKPRCQFFLPHKQRNCKFEAVNGKGYCGNHLYLGSGEGARRVPCTIDPTHDVVESEMETHLQTCTTRVRIEEAQSQSYWRPGCNAGPSSAAVQLPGQDGAAPLSAQRAAYARALGLPAMLDLIRRVDNANEQVCPQPAEPQELVPPGAALEQRNTNLPFSIKHARQQASIVGHMQLRELLDGAAGTAYLEFGAGAGYLSGMLAGYCEARKLLLIDSGTFRLKADRGLRHLKLQRLRIGIEDLWLPGLPLFTKGENGGKVGGGGQPGNRENGSVSGGQRWAALGKHLCGAASDFTLRCAIHSLQNGTGVLRGLCIATCCHHRCTWQHFVNKPFFQRLGFDAEEFELISWMTGWALCGHEAPAGTVNMADGNAPCAAINGAAEVADAKEEGTGGIPRPRRIDVGQKCKALIDQGRLEWLQESGFQAESALYVPAEVSGENRLLVATMMR